MANLYLDSFDHYTTLTQKGWSVVGAVASVSAGNGRNGTASLRTTNLNSGVTRVLASTYTTLIVGFAFKSTLTAGVSTAFLRLLEGATLHIDLRFDATGHIIVTRNGTTLATSTTILSASVFYYIELKVSISDTTGSIDMQINGVAETLTFASGSNGSQDTRNGGSGNISVLGLGGGGNDTRTSDWDDLYVNDTTGSVNNGFEGDVRVQANLPDGNGNYSALTGSDGNSVNNYQQVDENPPDTADYNESSNPTDKDSYTFSNLTPTSGTVLAVQVCMYAAKTDAGVRQIRSLMRLSGTDATGPTVTLSTTATYYLDIRETKPGGGSWSVSDVNNAEVGVEIVA